ncbi:hypothetical protein KDW_45460 [Dictyobacter vulcani]|uniref:non-specific serine/threonine protein kinase n=1 Tax=Dictyobacter vulcani TaxID=2607529 RepID=A0A5J4KLS5_9CHLR|nr:serine/threonine-protein kinase [Dictyobacter vulcani]GER90384.1 hypothetical protein KDW_45460 [Dictyobacter vulcani]
MNKNPGYFGKYEMLEPIGTGGMAQVWKALNPDLRRFVAIKILHADLKYMSPATTARFITEGQAVAQLDHPNIVNVYDLHIPDATEEGREPFLVMKYIEGPTLSKYIQGTSRASQFPTPQEIIELFASISLALDYAHKRGIIHRDVKPSNILLDSTNTEYNSMGEPILSDFGLVKIMGAQGQTEVGALMGTPLYISPEQVQGKEVSHKSDLYSLGVILYEVCTGTPPFRGDNSYAIMRQHLMDEPPRPSLINPALSPEVDEVIQHAMAKDPAQRFNKATSMTIALAQAFHVPVPERIRPHASKELELTPPSIEPAAIEAQTTLLPVPAAKTNRIWKNLWPFFIAALILIVLGATVLNKLLTLFPSGAASPKDTVVGQVTFYNTGNALDLNHPTINDGIKLQLNNIAPPAAGNSYTAWLYNQQSENDPLQLGTVNVQHGAATLTYTDPAHQNLLAAMSDFVLIEAPANQHAINPILDTKQWRYAGSLPRQPNPNDPEKFSQLDHLRHLLASDQTLDVRGLHNGIDFWLQHDVEQIQKQTTDIKNQQDPIVIRQKLTNMLYYLDGPCAANEVQSSGHLPAAPEATIITETKVGLLQCAQLNGINGHVKHVGLHLTGIVNAPGATEQQIKLANDINSHLSKFNTLLTSMHTLAIQLSKMNKGQLVAAHTQRNQLDQLGDFSISSQGWTDPASQSKEPGIARLCNQIAGLANIEVHTYLAKH